ncbi:uncharacterized protein At4g17910-like [Copidosoma floridanum]|uniref:uncharacterized protein At4g17910-like n=1 Tax=Copidosoma floridanum TaxID=29053 RepID=UPI0006C9ACA5|nr:uncharacterized protein At4g17910-like [Copidosoma floridanum]
MDTGDYQRYRREQLEAVSNQSGSSASDVLFVIFPNFGSILLALTLITLFGHRINELGRIFIEFSTVIVSCILCCTVLSDKVVIICQIFFILSAANILSILSFKPKDSLKSLHNETSSKIPFVTNFRAMTNIISIICILAVDFKCFPRKYVKTETYGYSLMDTGVGLFIMANALVSPEARLVDSDTKMPFLKGTVKTIKGCIPLLVLGLARYVSVEIIGYQKHVTEYGVHWNFFLTLVCVRLFTGVLSKSLSSKYSLLTGLWILGMHEYALSTQGLKEWVLSDEPRDDLISANREGWVSIPGYVGLYLLGVALGRLIYSTYKDLDSQLVFHVKFSTYEFHIGYTRSMSLTVKLYAIANVAFLVTYYCERYFLVSRRLANSGYCAWIFTISALFLTCFLMIDVIMECITGCVRDKCRRKVAKHLRRDDLNAKESVIVVKTLEIFEAVNENGLLFFLFANLLTGAINMTIKTLHVDEPQAVIIIITYMVTNLTLVLLRYRGKNILSAKKKN